MSPKYYPVTCLIQPGLKFAFFVSPKPTEPHKHFTPEAPLPIGYVWLSAKGVLRFTRADGVKIHLAKVNGNGKPKGGNGKLE